MMKRFFVIVIAFFTTTIINSCTPETFDSFGNIAGTVIDIDTCEPLNQAYITLTPTSKNIYSGMNGQFEFKELEAGQYTVQSQKTGYQTDRTIVNVVAGETVSVSLVMKKK